jgi:3-oxoacyl-[acyl-carrier-protein] synthase-3
MTTERVPPPRPRCRSLTGVQIIGTGSYVPENVVTNEDLNARLGHDSDWIVKRTGIRERRHASPNQATSDLCCEAAERCLKDARKSPADIDLLVLATFSPDFSFPATANIVQDKMHMNCPGVEVQAACSGFLYALVTAAAYVKSGASDMAMVIGGDCNSRITNPDDLKTYPLFGDGAGAVILTHGEPNQGLLSYSLGSDGAGGDLLCRPACGSRLPATAELLSQGKQFMYMDGRAVFRWAVGILCDTIQDVLKASNLKPSDIDLYLPHQANIRIINAAIDVLKIPRGKVFNNLDRYGNTSAGSVPICLDEAAAQGRIKRGNLLILSGFGAGLAWGTSVFRW